MEQITLKLDDTLLNKMKSRMEKNNCKTFSKCARELIDLGLRIEEAASAQDEKNDMNGLSPALLELLKTNLTWLLETRFLTRFLVQNVQVADSESATEMLNKAKERAIAHADELIQNIK